MSHPLPLDKIDFYSLSSEETLLKIGSNVEKGLSDEDVKQRTQLYSLNELEAEEKESIFQKIKEQFEDILVRLLLVAAIVSFLISWFSDTDEHSLPAWVEPFVIFLILIVNACVGIYQDMNAEKAIDALHQLQSIKSLVKRNGKLLDIESKYLVPGDIVIVHPGDKIPADMRVLKLETPTFKVDEVILTGEIDPVSKTTIALKGNDLNYSEKRNLLFSGTLVSSGICVGVIVGTGKFSALGQIQKLVQEAKAEKEDEETPLKKRLNEFGDLLAKSIAVICFLIWIINFRNFFDPAFGNPIKGALYYFKIAIALAVAAIPEGLPAVITTCLALGSRKMAKQNAIVRRLMSVETLGCTTVICSDKTGTLTTNKMSVKEGFIFGRNETDLIEFQVEGSSFEPYGKIHKLENLQGKDGFDLLIANCCLNNDSKLIRDSKDGKINIVGLPTEAAIKVFAQKAYNPDQKKIDDVEKIVKDLEHQYQKLATLEFTRDRKAMSVLVKKIGDKENFLLIKGAPDYILEHSNTFLNGNGEIVPISSNGKKIFQDKVIEYASKGLRCLCFTYKQNTGILQNYNPNHQQNILEDVSEYANLEKDSIILGVLAMQDPPRPQVKEAIQKCNTAGIQMVTGDIKETGVSIAQQVSIINKEDNNVFLGKEFAKLSKEKQKAILSRSLVNKEGLVFSRTDPKDKKTLIQLYSELGQIVAMTGDGVNDAPALTQAHIGIAMGITGTEVSKESSDMILADDNFATIVCAIEEGRAIYANMKAFIRYMISSNIGEVASIFLSSMLGLPDGFNSIQLLWVNLVTDGLPATALSFNPPDPDVMEKPPRKSDEPIIDSWTFVRYLVIGAYVGISTVGIFVYWYTSYDWSVDNQTLVTFEQLSRWGQCQNWENFKVAGYSTLTFKDPCSYFTYGKMKASTLSLTVLVMIEMLNAINALSEDSSILKVGLFANPFLIYAIGCSVFLHCIIVYVPFFQRIFSTLPLSLGDWGLVLAFTLPVILIDEILKYISRTAKRSQKIKVE